MANNFVSVILPCYNEKENVIPLIEEIHNVISAWDHQIIVVDDNSPDQTYQAIVAKQYSYVKAVLREKDPSLARSIRTGIEHADGDIIVVMDSDFNHRPEELPILLSNLQFYDCVSASRFLYGGRMNSRFRHIASWLFNVFVRITTWKFITDSLFGYFAIKKSVLEKINYDDVFWGYGDYCIRLMYYLQKNNVSILQIPAVLGKRRAGTGNSKLVKTFFQYTKATLALITK